MAMTVDRTRRTLEERLGDETEPHGGTAAAPSPRHRAADPARRLRLPKCDTAEELAHALQEAAPEAPVDALERVSAGRTDLGHESLKLLAGLDRDVEVMVSVTPSRPYRPAAASMANQMALAADGSVVELACREAA